MSLEKNGIIPMYLRYDIFHIWVFLCRYCGKMIVAIIVVSNAIIIADVQLLQLFQ